ncbi:hypothetical protein J4480_06655 [Candidatus Woesearchaeota archaeon]|nr:hypothetical protein [Candidatus Woesearchaeota archaeon]
MKQKIIPIAAIFLVFILFLSACSSKESKSVCGNKIMEAGEQCDASGCTANQICTEKCKCETFSPPSLPE